MTEITENAPVLVSAKDFEYMTSLVIAKKHQIQQMRDWRLRNIKYVLKEKRKYDNRMKMEQKLTDEGILELDSAERRIDYASRNKEAKRIQLCEARARLAILPKIPPAAPLSLKSALPV